MYWFILTLTRLQCVIIMIYVSELGQHWFRQWLVACSALSHTPKPMLDYCQLDPYEQTLVKSESKYKNLVTHENVFQKVVSEIAAIMWRWVSTWYYIEQSNEEEHVSDFYLRADTSCITRSLQILCFEVANDVALALKIFPRNSWKSITFDSVLESRKPPTMWSRKLVYWNDVFSLKLGLRLHHRDVNSPHFN